ncbi:urea amidolyase [Patiriisocius marinus]|uniref:Urea amidolyase n=1 Tax=Patiriisocius marinus TaxID=1397112 RepID=A0A5J4INW0_9FLAO|nr:allophanate hydrolase subunit 2 family protein [Patiriisocius marinus]GER59209.1 urea amidolyase [Patiriisocius marinus]
MIEVLKPGLYTTLQDGGRYGFRSIGVPLSGFMDRASAQYANYLVGNDINECALEFVGIPPMLRFNVATQIVIAGSSQSILLDGISRNRGEVIMVEKGAILSFSSIKAGWRGYIAFKNGIDSQVSLNSQSQYKGITERLKIEKNDVLSLKLENFNSRVFKKYKYNSNFYNLNIVEVYKGPEFEFLSQEVKRQLLESTFTISPSSYRMATLIEENINGKILDIITAPVQPGTIQLTPSGKLIILMRDAQTSGGYSRVFQCSENAINLLSQKRPKEQIIFKLKSYGI